MIIRKIIKIVAIICHILRRKCTIFDSNADFYIIVYEFDLVPDIYGLAMVGKVDPCLTL